MKKEKLHFHIVLLGQIAAGKDTQAKLLLDRYEFKPVESGKYWRKMLKAKTPDGDLLRRTTGKGWAAPVKLMKKFLETQLAAKPKNKMLLFQGNPRLKPEAQLLQKLLKIRKEPFLAFYISLPDKEIYARSFKRGQKESNVKAIYKVFDNDKKLIRNRIKWHKEQVSKTVSYFKSLGHFKKIDGKQSIEKVHQDIEQAIQAFEKKLTLTK